MKIFLTDLSLYLVENYDLEYSTCPIVRISGFLALHSRIYDLWLPAERKHRVCFPDGRWYFYPIETAKRNVRDRHFKLSKLIFFIWSTNLGAGYRHWIEVRLHMLVRSLWHCTSGIALSSCRLRRALAFISYFVHSIICIHVLVK